jgi:hypothetical protein
VGKTWTFILGIILLSSFGLNSARADAPSDISPLDKPDYNPDHDQYERSPSRYAFGLRLALDSFPILTASGNSYQFFGDWVLPFKAAGLLSVGAHLGFLPIVARNSGVTGIPYPNYGSAMGGLQFRYQMLWTQNQLLVPTAAVEADYYRIVTNSVTTTDSNGKDTTAITTTSGMALGVDLGLMINLGKIDGATARDAYQTISLTRAYLTLEWHPLKISNDVVDLSGNFFYTGLRMEFE